MSEGTVVPRRLLLVDPCAACERLLPSLRSSGWRAESCSLESVAAEAFDIGLLCLHTRHFQRPRWLAKLVTQGSKEWIALLGTDRPPTSADRDFAAEWFFDSHQHPFDITSLQRSLRWAEAATRLHASGTDDGELLGQSRVVRDLRKRLTRLGASDAPVLIRGESGSGRSLVAQHIHRCSSRAAGPFRAFECAALDPAALANALASALAEADEGTLFLAEIGDLPLFLQEELFARLHRKGTKPNVRLLASTCVDLQAAVEQLCFSRRLFAWLERRQLIVEPLRKRQGDIALLASYCAVRYGGESPRREFSEEALAAMRLHPWPGNVRELIKRVRRGLVAAGEQIEAGDLGLESAGSGMGLLGTLEEYKRRAEYQALCDALGRYGNNLSLAARVLGISRPTFYRLLHKHQLL